MKCGPPPLPPPTPILPIWRLTQESSGLPQDYFSGKHLSQATRCTRHFMPNSLILHSHHRGAGVGWGAVGVSFVDAEVETQLILDAPRWTCESACEKTFEGQKQGPNLISLGAGGVASFIRLQNRRPACHSVRHALAKSATCSFPRQKVAILNESLAPSLLPLRWPHTLPWLWLQCSRLTCMPTFALPNSNISKHKAFAVDLSATARSLLSARLWMLLFHNLCHGPPWQPEWLCFKAFTFYPSGSLVDTCLHL